MPLSKQQGTLYDIANEVCEKLPKGWLLTIDMENGAGWVELYNPDAEKIDPAEFNSYDGLESDVRSALEFARQEDAFTRAQKELRCH